MPSNTFNIEDLIGKRLTARIRVNVKGAALDDQPTLYTVEPGNAIGVIYDFLPPKLGRKNAYWMIDTPDRVVFVEQGPGRFDTKDLEQQGAVTIYDQAWQDKPFLGKVLSIGAYVLGAWVFISIAQMNERKNNEPE